MPHPRAGAPSSREVAARALGACALFDEVSTAVVDRLAGDCRTVRLERGEVLFHRGEPSRGFFVVMSGCMKLAVTAADGRERVIEVIYAGYPFAEATIFAQRPYPVTASALEPTRVLHVPAEPVLDQIADDPLLARQMLAGLSARLHTLVRDIGAASLQSASARLVGFLLATAGGADGVAPSPVTVDLRVSKQVLASRLGLRPETLSRVLHRLVTDGLVEVDGRHVRIPDVDALRSFAAGP